MQLRLSPRSLIPLFVLAGLATSGVATGLRYAALADGILFITLVAGSLPLFIDIARAIARGHFGVDIIALAAIIGALVFHQYLAGTVILLMLSGGEALEGFALRRARRELTSLINNAPTIAHKKQGGTVIDVSAERIQPGDRILVKPGEIIPVDGRVISGTSMVDESALTGEAVLVHKGQGMEVMSGAITKDGVLELEALRQSQESKYARIIKLVEEAERNKAPFVRLADRYSVWFTSLAFTLAIGSWLMTGDPVRALAVLVVATPCPLILATPIAFAAGIGRAAGRGIIVKNGGILEQLGEARTLAFDKTGTLTLGTPTVQDALSLSARSNDDILMIAASLDQLSTHVLGRSIREKAAQHRLTLHYPEKFEESFGKGVSGTIGGTPYAFGSLAYLQGRDIRVTEQEEKIRRDLQSEGRMVAFLADAGDVIGYVSFADHVRPQVKNLFQDLRHLGLERVIMLTGDHRVPALRVAKEVGIEAENVRAELLPEEKVHIVEELKRTSPPVVMVGDGVNDAPAITAANVGIAMGAHGSTASVEAGDIVIMVDQIERVGEALKIGKAVLRIALESVWVGIGLSILLMILAALGYVSPVYGAMLQEVIDVAVILNALRVLLVKV